MTSGPGLHFDITGDCSGLTAATRNADAAISSLDGKTAGVAVTLAGGDRAVRGLEQVGAARAAAGGTISLGVDTSGLAAGRADVRGYGADVRSLGRDLDAAGASRAFGLQDDGSLSRVAGGLRGVGSDAVKAEGQFGRLGASASQSFSDVNSGAARAGQGMQGLEVNSRGAASGMESHAGASAQVARGNTLVADSGAKAEASVRGATTALKDQTVEAKQLVSAMAGGNSSVTSAQNAVGKGWGALSGGPRNAGAGIGSPVSGGSTPFNLANLSPWGQAQFQGTAPIGPQPPMRPPPGGGGGGGGGGAGGGTPRTPRPSAAKKPPSIGDPTSQILGDVGTVAGELAGNAMLGLAATGVAAAAGAGAVLETIKHLPAAMQAAHTATNQFGKALTNAVAGAAVSKGEFQALGQALGGLGSEVGRVGLQNMNAVVGGAADLAGNATSALKSLEPAIPGAINGVVALGDAFLKGVSSPQVVSGIEGVSKALSSATNEQGISNAVSGLATIGTIAATAATNIAGIVDAGDSPAAEPALIGAAKGAMMGSSAGWKGALAGGLIGGGALAIAADQQSKGEDPTSSLGYGAGGAILGRMLGTPFGPAGQAIGATAGFAGGELLGAGDPGGKMFSTGLSALGATGSMAGTLLGDVANVPSDIGKGLSSGNWAGLSQDSAAFKQQSSSLGQAWSRAVTPGGANQPDAPASPQEALASAQKAAPFGYDQAKDGSLSASSGPGGGGGVYAGGPGATPQRPTPPIPAPRDLPPSSPGATGGSGSGAPTLASAQALQRLSGALPPANSGMQQLGGTSSTASSGLSRVQQSTTGVGSSMSQLQQSSTSASQPLQQVAQHANTAAQSVTTLGQNSAAAAEPMKQLAPTVTQSLSQAHAAIQSGGQSIGQAAPAAMAAGITQNTAQACDASNQMGKSAVDCAKAAVKSASPSKEFMSIGESTGQGFAIGVQSTAGLASGAVSQAMTGALGAGAAAMQTASPSKAFAALGQGMMQQVAQGAQGQMSGTQAKLGNTLSGLQAKSVIPQAGLAGQGQGSVDFGGQYAQNAASQRAQEQAKQGQDKQTAAQREDAAIRAGLSTRGWGSTTQDLVANQIEARGGNKAAADKRESDAQKRAQDAIGGNFRSPQEQSDAAKQRASDAQARLRGSDPGQQRATDAQNAQNKALGAGATNAPIPSSAVLLPQQAVSQGNQVGQGLTQGLTNGLNQGAGAANNAAGNMGQGVVDQVKKKTGVNSPSTITTQYGLEVAAGMTGGLTSGITAASGAISPVASNSGLMVGYVYGQGIVSGALSVLKSADYASAAVSGVGSQLAEAALGKLNMLGPAGAGGEVNKVLPVTLSGSTPIQVQVTNQVLLDGSVVDTKVNTAVGSSLNGLITALNMQ